MKKPASINVNLLPKDPFFSSVPGRFFQWAISAGRYLVIFTEVVVIMSFASRFTIDRQITDLNTQILQKKVVVKSYGDLEEKIRSTQKKIEAYQQVEQQENIVDVFPKLSEITPNDVQLTELKLEPGKVTLVGRALSNVSLSVFISNLQVSPNFSDVTVDKVGTATNNDPGFEFYIQATTKNLTSK